jgi:hypothetical protein
VLARPTALAFDLNRLMVRLIVKNIPVRLDLPRLPDLAAKRIEPQNIEQ